MVMELKTQNNSHLIAYLLVGQSQKTANTRKKEKSKLILNLQKDSQSI